MAQTREPYDRLRGQFLRELHAALVVSAVGIVQIDVRQLFGATQRTALDLLDVSGRRVDAALVSWHQEMRRQAGAFHGQDRYRTVSVMAPSAAEADALSTAFSLMPLSDIADIVAIRPNVQARIVDAGGTLVVCGA